VHAPNLRLHGVGHVAGSEFALFEEGGELQWVGDAPADENAVVNAAWGIEREGEPGGYEFFRSKLEIVRSARWNSFICAVSTK
jgi:hypothetical protein